MPAADRFLVACVVGRAGSEVKLSLVKNKHKLSVKLESLKNRLYNANQEDRKNDQTNPWQHNLITRQRKL